MDSKDIKSWLSAEGADLVITAGLDWRTSRLASGSVATGNLVDEGAPDTGGVGRTLGLSFKCCTELSSFKLSKEIKSSSSSFFSAAVSFMFDTAKSGGKDQMIKESGGRGGGAQTKLICHKPVCWPPLYLPRIKWCQQTG